MPMPIDVVIDMLRCVEIPCPFRQTLARQANFELNQKGLDVRVSSTVKGSDELPESGVNAF